MPGRALRASLDPEAPHAERPHPGAAAARREQGDVDLSAGFRVGRAAVGTAQGRLRGPAGSCQVGAPSA